MGAVALLQMKTVSSVSKQTFFQSRMVNYEELMILRVRFDDVMWKSSNDKFKGKELGRLKMHIDWMKDLPQVTLAPNILCQDIMEFPESLAYIQNEANTNERFTVDLHGWDHGPYAPRNYDEISEHLDKSLAWFKASLPAPPLRWVTPHGANGWAMQRAAKERGLVIETTDDPVIDQREADKLLRVSRDIKKLDNKIIMVHWWERGMALYRIARVLQHGGVSEAIIESKHELEDSAWRACWGEGWHQVPRGGQ